MTHNCIGCQGDTKCCCSSYEVSISSSELTKIIGCIPDAAKFCPHLKSHNGYENVFEQIGLNLFRIDTAANGLCVFAYSKDNKTLCSLHSVSINLGVSVHQVKPKTCLIWPLAISEGKRGILSMHEDALEFRCNAQNHNDSLSLCPNIGRIVESAFGQRFRCELGSAANKGLHRTKIPLHGPIAGEL
jgi:hypothetical protein